MARKIKNLTSSIQSKVTTLKLESGKYTEIGKETCEEMMAKHFPTHTPKTNPEYDHTKIVTTEITKSEFKPWITPTHVRRVLLKFKAKKYPGPDKFKPIIFKYLPQKTLDIISFIYKSCLKLHCTPRAWKESNVVFIPKKGKTLYQEAKSFRPIYLAITY